MLNLPVLSLFLPVVVTCAVVAQQPIAKESPSQRMKRWAEEEKAQPKAPEVVPGLVWVSGWLGSRHDWPRTQGAGVHIHPGWVLVDREVILGLPIVTVIQPKSLSKEEDRPRRMLVTRVVPCGKESYVWLEVPALASTATVRSSKSTPVADMFLFGFLEDNGRSRNYRMAVSSPAGSHLVKALSNPFHYAVMGETGNSPDRVGAYPLFDSSARWAGFLTRKEPPRGGERRIFNESGEVGWDRSAIFKALPAPGAASQLPDFPWESLDALLGGWTEAQPHLAKLDGFASAHPDNPWGWFVAGMVRNLGLQPENGLTHLRKAAVLAPNSSIVAWVYADALRDALAFEEAAAAYRKAIQLDPTPAQWTYRSKRIGDVFHLLGDHEAEFKVRFGGGLAGDGIDSHRATVYGTWLREHGRGEEAVIFLKSAFAGLCKKAKTSWDRRETSEVRSLLMGMLHQAGRHQEEQSYLPASKQQNHTSEDRNTLSESWSAHGEADSHLELFKHWMKTPCPKSSDDAWASAGEYWLHSLPKPMLERLLAEDRALLQAFLGRNFDGDGSLQLAHFLGDTLGRTEEALQLYQRLETWPGQHWEHRVRLLKAAKRDAEIPGLLCQAEEEAGKRKDGARSPDGSAWMEAGIPDRAKSRLMQETQGRERSWGSWESLGRAHLALGETQEAMTCFLKALKINRDGLVWSWSHHGTSSQAFPLGLLRDTIRAGGAKEVQDFCTYSASLGLCPNLHTYSGEAPSKVLEEIRDLTGLLNKLKKPDLAERIYLIILQEAPDFADIWLMLGNHRLNYGNDSGAKMCLRRLKALSSPLGAELESSFTRKGSNPPAVAEWAH